MAFMSMIIVTIAFGLLLSLPGYILTGISLYTIAKRRGIYHPWVAWVPMFHFWLIGCISDQYQSVVKGKTKNKRTILLVLAAASVVLYAAMFFAALTIAEQANALLMLAFFLPAWCAAAAVVVVGFMALYDLYASCIPENRVLFLVLSILFGITQPFFLFACRKKDKGMPPKRV